MTGMGHGLGTAENGERELRRRGVVGAALHHGADTGRWRGHAPIPFPGA
ncbi:MULTISPECIES: hypothetical protein [Nocardiopsis]|nr:MULTISPECIES: hypothetical protein [Nocardiopsis]